MKQDVPGTKISYGGVYTRSLDDKSRFSLPLEFRQAGEEKFDFISHPEFDALIAIPPSKMESEGDEFKETVESFSMQRKLDGEGRLAFNLEFQKETDFDATDGFKLIGMKDHFHVLTEENWKKYKSQYNQRLSEVLKAGGIWVPRRIDN